MSGTLPSAGRALSVPAAAFRGAALALLGAALGGALAVPAGAFDAVATSPGRYALQVPSNLGTISVTFDEPLATPPAGVFRVCGTMSGLKSGTVSVAGPTVTFTTAEPWLPGELVNVNLRASLQSAGGTPLVGGFYFAFTIESAPASLAWDDPMVYGASDVPYFIFGGDIDGDGTPDVVAPNEGTNDVSVFLNPGGTGVFTGHADYPVGNTPSSIFGEDFDNDGDLDFATADIASGTMSVGLNQGAGTFAPTTSYASGSNTRQVHGGDFDGDNDVDICTTSRATGQVFLFYNQGNGVFSPGVPFGDVSAGPFAIRAADLDLDGHLDIAVACQDVDSVNVLTNDGTGSFTNTGSYRTGDGPWCLNGNDFDGDGDFDLVTVASFNNRIQILINDGTGAFPTKTGVPTGSFPLGVFAADLDGDGDIDATSSNYGAGTVGVYVNNGTAALSLQETLQVDRSGSYTWAHDLDGDGDLDLSVVDELTDSLYVFYNGPAPAVDSPAIVPGSGGGARLAVHPNPARAGGALDIEIEGLAGSVTVDVFGVDGRRVRRIHSGRLPEGGSVSWDGRDAAGRPLPSGTYLVAARGNGARAGASVQLVR